MSVRLIYNPTLTGAIDVSGLSNKTGSGSLVLATAPTVTGLITNTINGLTITSSAGGVITLAAGKTLTFPNTLTLAGTDGSTLAIGAGGTLGTAAYTASTAYVAAGGAASLTTLAASGAVTFTLATASSSTTTGAVVFTGGIGVGGVSYVSELHGTQAVFTAGIASTSSTTGTLITVGGIGCGGALFAANSISAGGGLICAQGTGLTVYNTVDQTTNYERGLVMFNSNILQTGALVGGTGTPRVARFGTGTFAGATTLNNYISLNTAAPFVTFGAFTTGAAGTQFQMPSNTYTNASGTIVGVLIAPTYNQTSSGGDVDLQIKRTETALGSGSQLMLQCLAGLTGATQVFSVSNAGAVTIGNGGTAIGKSSTFTLAVSAAVAGGAMSSQDITATGIVAGDTVSQVEMTSIQPTGLVVQSVRCGTDKITVDFFNTTAGSLSLTGTIKVRSFKA